MFRGRVRKLMVALLSLVFMFLFMGCENNDENENVRNENPKDSLSSISTTFNDDSSEPQQTDGTISETQLTFPTVETNTGEQESDVPLLDVISSDFQVKLTEKDENVTISEININKSMTEEKSYSVTVSVNGVSKYADWTYEANMVYTKYDQGWFLDNLDWIDSYYVLSRIPTLGDIQCYAKEVFLENDIPFSPSETDMINTKDTLETEVLSFSWYSDIQYKHGYASAYFDSKWEYDEKSDNWTLMDEIPSSEYDYNFFAIYREVENVSITADFTGDWGAIKIEDFSPYGFKVSSAVINDGEYSRVDSSTIPNINRDADNILWFSSDDVDNPWVIYIVLGEDKSSICACKPLSHHFCALSVIEEDLPALSDW